MTVVDDYIDARAPEGAITTALAPSSLSLDLTINPAAAYDTAAKRAAVETVLHQLCALVNASRYPDVSDPLGIKPAPGTALLYNSEIRTTIGLHMEQFVVTDVNADGTGLSNVPVAISQAIRVGTVTWV